MLCHENHHEKHEKSLLSRPLPAGRMQVKAGLVPLLADIRSRGSAPCDAWLKGDYDTEKQVGWWGGSSLA